MGNHLAALKDFNDAIEHDEDLAEGYYLKGVSQYHLHQYKEAIKNFELAKDKEDKRVGYNTSNDDQ